jgi:hypothetical protein
MNEKHGVRSIRGEMERRHTAMLPPGEMPPRGPIMPTTPGVRSSGGVMLMSAELEVA